MSELQVIKPMSYVTLNEIKVRGRIVEVSIGLRCTVSYKVEYWLNSESKTVWCDDSEFELVNGSHIGMGFEV